MLFVNLYLEFFSAVLNLYIASAMFVTLMVLYAANAVYAILFLIGAFLFVGFIFLVLGVEYLGLVLMIVYIGAIAILFLFILMLLDLKNLMKQRVPPLTMWLFSVAIFGAVEATLWNSSFGPGVLVGSLSSLLLHTTFGGLISDSLLVLSPALYNVYFYYMIGCGFILLFIMVGVVILLAEWAFPFNEKSTRLQNKILVQYQDVVQNASLK